MEYFNNPIDGLAYPVITKDTPDDANITPIYRDYSFLEQVASEPYGNSPYESLITLVPIVDLETPHIACVYPTDNDGLIPIPLDYDNADMMKLLSRYNFKHNDAILGVYLRHSITGITLPFTEHVRYVKEFILPNVPIPRVVVLRAIVNKEET